MNWHWLIASVTVAALACPAVPRAQVALGRPPSNSTLSWQQLQIRQQEPSWQLQQAGQQQLRQPQTGRQSFSSPQQHALQQQLALQNLARQQQLRQSSRLPRQSIRSGYLGFIILPQDIELLRANPQQFGGVYQAYAAQLRNLLGQDYIGLTDEGYAAIFACLVSYQMRPYRPLGAKDGPPNDTFPSLMRLSRMACNEYCEFATDLFATLPPAARPRATITMAGFGHGIFGDHSQLWVTGVGVPLLLDPTIGLVAPLSLEEARAGKHVPANLIWQSTYRHYYPQPLAGQMNLFAQHVRTAVLDGLYPNCTYLYNMTLLPAGGVAWGR